jgi:hypothetical protein
LKAIIAGEKELREERRGEEQTAIAMISEDIYLQSCLTEEDCVRVQRQREVAEA